MPWTVSIDGTTAYLHWQPEGAEEGEERPVWSGSVEIFRGAPGWNSHPELHHGLLALLSRQVHKPYITETWTWDVPNLWQGVHNTGDRRRYLLLSGGRLQWSLVLRFSPQAPFHAYRALADAFGACLKGEIRHAAQGTQPDAEERHPEEGADPCPAQVAAGRSDGGHQVDQVGEWVI